MKIFISWSGDQAKQIAEFLREWLPTVLAGSVSPWVSSQDIAKGERGLNVIAKELEAINYGIVVLTKSNYGAPWVNFESGAIAKSLGEAHVSTVLVDVTRADITGPLSQFQDTVLGEKADVKKLLDDIAATAGGSVPQATLDVMFENLWPQLEAKVKVASGGVEPTTDRGEKDILEEVLDLVRSVQRDVANSRGVAYDRGRFADSTEAFDIVELVRLLNTDPALQDRIASGDISLVRQILKRVRMGNRSRQMYKRLENERIRAAEEDAARAYAADEAASAARDDRGYDVEHDDDAVFLGETIK